MFPEKTFNAGEITINYGDSETPGPPLVLLHGLTSAWKRHWTDFIPLFSPKWHVIAPDFRGHGKSGHVSGQYRFVDYAQDTVALLRGLFSEPAVLMGHSLGAVTSIAVAGQTPELVRALVLLDPPLFLRNRTMDARPGARDWFTFVYETVKSSASYDEIAAQCRAALPDAPEVAIKDMADQFYGLDSGIVAPTQQNAMMDGWDLGYTLQNIPCPTLLMRGDWNHEAALDDSDAAFVKENLPHVVDVKIANGTHHFHNEQKDLTMQHIEKFLASLPR